MTLQAIHSPSHSHCGSTHSRSPSSSPAAGGPDTPSKEKIGVPIFRDDNGQRRLHLVVDLGTTFRPNEITVQVNAVSPRIIVLSCGKLIACTHNRNQLQSIFSRIGPPDLDNANNFFLPIRTSHLTAAVII